MSASGDLRDRIAALSPAQRAKLENLLAAAPASAASDRAEPIGDAFPLTDVQQAYWVGRGEDFALGGVATHAYSEIDATDLDLDRLTVAWNQVVARHEMLRTIVDKDGTQRTLASVPFYEIALDDLRGLPKDEAEEQLAALRRRMSHQVLPTSRWPIFEIRATRLSERCTRLHLSFDAIVADLSSRRVAMREWGAFYADELEPPPLEEQRFRDFVLAEHAGKDGPHFDRARNYWRARLDRLPPPPQLPLQDPQTNGLPPRFTRRSHRLDSACKAALEQVAVNLGVTLNVLLLNAYADVLRLWSDVDAFTLNLTLFNRPATMKQVVGDFTTLTLSEIEAPGPGTLGERLARLQAQLWRDLDHRQFNGVQVMRELARRRGGAEPTLMPVVFTSALGGDAEIAWLGHEVYSVSQTPQVWIDLMIVGDGDGLVIHWNAVEHLFPPGMMQEMLETFVAMVEGLARGTINRASRWPEIAEAYLPEPSRRARDAANATAGPLPDRLLHQPWRDHVRTAPARPAIIDGERTLSYAELSTVVDDLAHRLRERGTEPNTLVAIVMAKGWRQIAAALAVLEAGAAYLPIDPQTPAERLRYLLANSGARLALTQAPLLHELPWPPETTPIDVDALAFTANPVPLEPSQSMSDVAYVIYTSGSEGTPKGVAVDHRGAANTILDINRRFGIGRDDRVLALSALTFDLSVYDMFGVLGVGGAIVIPSDADLRDPERWASLSIRHQVTVWNSAPAFMDLLVDYARMHPALRLPDLRLVMLSGDWIPTSLPQAIRPLAPAAKLVSLGGATEASIWSIFHEIRDEDARLKSIPYGKPLTNQTFEVLGADFVARPTWVPGELYIGGLGLAKGYWFDEARTASAFVTHPRTGERLYRTGDHGRYLPDGAIEFLGRRDNQVKVRGFRVELGEIEAVLARHPQVRTAVVVVNDLKLLSAFLIPSGGGTAAPSSAEITSWLRDHLPGYMQPSSVTVVTALPLTTNGKVDRKALAALSEPSAATPAEPRRTSSHADADRLLALARRACQLPIASADANLLDLGLTSIHMIAIVNAVETELGFRPSIEAFYRDPTIRGLAQIYDAWLATGNQPSPRSTSGMADRVETLAPAAAARRVAETGAAIGLPSAELSEGLRTLLRERHSVRRFSLRPISMVTLSSLLEGLRRDRKTGKTTYGSASGLYPVQAYLYVREGRVDGLAGGLYSYDSADHALRPLPSTLRLRRSAFSYVQNAPIFDESAFVLFLVAEMPAIESTYGDQGLHLTTLEAGLMAQVLELSATDCGLGLCQVGQADGAMVGELLNLTDSHRLVHIMFGGEPFGQANSVGPGVDESQQLRCLIDRVKALSLSEARAMLGALEREE